MRIKREKRRGNLGFLAGGGVLLVMALFVLWPQSVHASESVQAPEANTISEKKQQPVVETVPVTTQQPVAETVPETTQQPGSETVPGTEQQTGQETEQQTGRQTEQQTGQETEQQTGQETEQETEQQTGQETEQETEQQTGQETEQQAGQESEANAASKMLGGAPETNNQDTGTEEDTREEEDPVIELPDGNAWVKEIGADVYGDTVLTYGNTTSGNGYHTGNAIQNAFDAAIQYAVGKNWSDNEKKEVTVVVENGEYVGDLNFVNQQGSDSFVDALLAKYKKTNKFFDAFLFIIRSSDSVKNINGAETIGTYSEGGVKIRGNIFIDNLNLILAGLSLGAENSITVQNADSFVYYGTKINDTVDIYTDSVNDKVDIYLGEGNDTLVMNTSQAPSFTVDVANNIVTQLTLPDDILDSLSDLTQMTVDEINSILTNGFKATARPTLDRLMEKLADKDKESIINSLIEIIRQELPKHIDSASEAATVNVHSGAGHDEIQVNVIHNNYLRLIPAKQPSGLFGIGTLGLAIDLGRTNVNIFGEEGNDQMLVSGGWSGTYETMILYKALKRLGEAFNGDSKTAQAWIYGGEGDDTLQISTDYGFSTVWAAKGMTDGGGGYDRFNMAGSLNDKSSQQIQKGTSGGMNTYTLDGTKGLYIVENITGTQIKLFGINKSMTMATNAEVVTDSLNDKKQVELTWQNDQYQGGKITPEDHMNYVIELTAESNGRIDISDIFNTINNPLDLAQLLIYLPMKDLVEDEEKGKDGYASIEEIYAPGWTVVISGKNIRLGKITAGNLFVSAIVPDMLLEETTGRQDINLEMNQQDTNNTQVPNNLDDTVELPISSQMYQYDGTAKIVFAGEVTVDGLVYATASLTMDRGYLSLPIAIELNPVVYKQGWVEIDVQNNITASAIQLHALTLVDIKSSLLFVRPVLAGISNTINYINIGKNGTVAPVLTAKEGSIWLDAKTRVTIQADAKAIPAMYVAIAGSAVRADTKILVTGNSVLRAAENIDLTADAVIHSDIKAFGAIPDRANPNVNSGVFVTVQMFFVDTKAEVSGTASLYAGKDISVVSDSRLEASAISLSVPGYGQQTAFKVTNLLKLYDHFRNMPQGKHSLTTLIPGGEYIKDLFNKGAGGAAEGEKKDHSTKQFAGAFGVSYVEHKNQALVTTSGKVEAGGMFIIDANAITAVDVRADGSLYKTALSAASSPNNAVGVGVGISVVKHNNRAVLDNSDVRADGLKAEAVSYTPSSLIVKAGHVPTSSSFGVAGAAAIHVYTAVTEALVKDDARAELGNGILEVRAYQDGDLKVIGDASGRRPTVGMNIGMPLFNTSPQRGSFGMGTGIAVNIAGMDVTAQVEKPLSGRGIRQQSGTRLSSINIESIFKGTEYVEARAGASGGTAIVPVLTLDVSGVAALAELNTLVNLAVSGDVRIHSDMKMIRTQIADADAIGAKVGFGGSFIVSIVEDTSESFLNSSVTADGDVAVTADAISRLNGKAYASAKGSTTSMTDKEFEKMLDGKEAYGSTQQKGQADKFADKNGQNGAKLANEVKTKNTNSSKVTKKVNNRHMASTAEGQVEIAAAMALNIQENTSRAVIGDGYQIQAKNVRMITQNDTDAVLHVSAAAVQSQIGVGVAAGINMVTYTNEIVLGTSGITADTLTLQAVVVELAQLKSVEQIVKDLMNFLTDVVGVEKFLQSMVYYDLNNKLPDKGDSLDDPAYKDLNAVLNYFDKKKANPDYVSNEEETKYGDLTAEDQEEVRQQLVKALTNLVMGGQTSDVVKGVAGTVVDSLMMKIRESMTKDNFLLMLFTGKNMFSEAFAQAGTLYNGTVPRIRMALAQYLNSRFGGAEEMDGVGHKISTQTVSGAGASNVGVAGSVALSIVDGKTNVIIKDRPSLPASDLNISGMMEVISENAQMVYTTATSSANEYGVSKDRLASALGTANASGTSKKYMSGSEGGNLGVGASAAISIVNSEVKAIVGKNRRVEAAALKVLADLRNNVESIAVAGQDPLGRRESIFGTEEQLAPPTTVLGGKPTNEQIVYYATSTQKIGVDAAAAINISTNTVTALVDGGTNLHTDGGNLIDTDEDENKKVNLYIRAGQTGKAYSQASGFAAGTKAAVGVGTAANVTRSNVLAKFAGTGVADLGDALIKATTYNEDTVFALATTTGANIDRISQKLGAIEGFLSVGSEGAPSNKVSNALMNQINAIYTPAVTAKTDRKPAYLILMNKLGLQIPDSSAAPSGSIPQDTGGMGQNLQVAAAVGVNMTKHVTEAILDGSLTLKDGGLRVMSKNSANYRTLGSGFNVSILDPATNTAGAGVAVSMNNNEAKALIDGTVYTPADVTVLALTTQNMDGAFAGLLSAQSLAGGISGSPVVSGIFNLTGAFSGAFSNAKTIAQIADGSVIAGINGGRSGDIRVIALDQSKQAVRAGSLTATANSVVTAGMSVAVLTAENIVQALIGDNVRITADNLLVQAMLVNVNEEDYKFPLDLSVLFTTGKNTQEEDKGIIHVNLEPNNFGFGVNLKTEDILKIADMINYLATVNYYAEAIANSISIGTTPVANMAGAVTVVLVNNQVEALIGNNAVIDITGNVTVEAQADTIARVIAGSISAGTPKVGTGLTVAVLNETNKIHAAIGDTANTTGTVNAAGGVRTTAKNREEVLVVNGAMVATAHSAASLGGGVTWAGNSGEVKASIGDKYQVSADTITVKAENDSDIKVISASPVLSGSAIGVIAAGGTVAAIQTEKAVESAVGNQAMLTAARDIDILASTQEKMLNVLASVSATTGAGSVAGTSGITESRTSTKALAGISTRLISETGNITLKAAADSWLLNILAAVSGSRQLAVGGVSMTALLDREVLAEVGAGSYLEAKQGNVVIQADSKGFVVLPTASGAAAGQGAVGGLITTVSGKDSVQALVGDYSVIKADGTAALTADNNQEIYLAGLAVEAAGSASAGASISNMLLDNLVKAFAGNCVAISALGNGSGVTSYNRKEKRDMLHKGILIHAAQYTRILSGNLGAAASTGQAAVNAIVQNVIFKNKVIAGTGSHAALNADVVRNSDGTIASEGQTGGGSSEQDIVIEADDESESYAIVGGLGVSGTAGVGIGSQALVYDKEVTASIGSGSVSYAVRDIRVTADNREKIWQVNVTITGGGIAAVDIAANTIIFQNLTEAFMGGKASGNNIDVKAYSDVWITSILASSVSSAKAAIVPSALVIHFNNQTKAYTLDGAVITARGDLTIDAFSGEVILSNSGDLALSGAAAVAGTVQVTIGELETQAYTGKNQTIQAQNVYVTAIDDYDWQLVMVSAGAGMSVTNVNAAVSVTHNTVGAWIGENSTVKAVEDVEVTATALRNLEMYGGSAAAGGAGTGATVLVVAAGGKVNQDGINAIEMYLPAEAILNGLKKGRDGEIRDYLNSYSESLSAALTGDGVVKSETQVGQKDKDGNTGFDGQSGYYDKDSMDKVKEDGSNDFTYNPDSNKDIEGAADLYDKLPDGYANMKQDSIYAGIKAGTSVEAGGDILVLAEDVFNARLITGNVTGSGGASIGAGIAAIVAYSNVFAEAAENTVLKAGGNIDITAMAYSDKTKEYSLQTNSVNGGLSGGLSGVASVAAIDIYSQVRAVLEGRVNGAQTLRVKAVTDFGAVEAKTLAAAAGLQVSVPASVAIVIQNGTMEAAIRNGAYLENVGSIYVTSEGNFHPVTEALSAGAGGQNMTIVLAATINRQKIATYIDETVTIKGAGLLEVKSIFAAEATPAVIGAGAGLVTSLGLQSIIVVDSSQIRTWIGVSPLESSAATKGKTIEAGTIKVSNDIKSHMDATGIYGSAGMVAANVTVLVAINRIHAVAQIAKTNIMANDIEVSSAMDALVKASLTGGTVGLQGAMGASVAVAQMFAVNRAVVDTTGVVVDTGAIYVTAGKEAEENRFEAEAKNVSAGAGLLANINVNSAIADNHAVNEAVITGSGTLKADSDIDVQAWAKAAAKATIESINASASFNVGAGFALALLRAEQKALAGDSGVVNGGNLKVQAGLNSNLTDPAAEAVIKGISGALINGNANISIAHNQSKNRAGAGGSNLSVNGDIDILSRGKANAKAATEIISAAAATASAQVAYAYSSAVFEAWLNVAGIVTAGDIRVRTSYQAWAESNIQPSTFGVLNIETNGAVAKVNGKADAYIKGKGTLTAKTVDVQADGSVKATAEAESALISIDGAKFGYNLALALLSGSQSAQVTIAKLNASALNVISNFNKNGEMASSRTGSAGTAISGAIHSGTANVAVALNGYESAALVHGTDLNVNGDVTVRSQGISKAEADRYSPAVEVSLDRVTAIHTQADASGKFRASVILGTGHSTMNRLTVEALFEVFAYAATESAGSAFNLIDIGINTAVATVSQYANAGVEAAGSLTVKGDVIICSAGHANATAEIRTPKLSLSAASIIANSAAAYAKMTQYTWFKVAGTADIGGNLRIESLLEKKKDTSSGAYAQIITQDGKKKVEIALKGSVKNDVLVAESRMKAHMELNGGQGLRIGGNLLLNGQTASIAKATGKGAGTNISILSVGNQSLLSYVENDLQITVDGMIQVQGDVDITALSDTISDLLVESPTFVGLVRVPIITVDPKVGKSGKANRVAITFGDNSTLKAKGNVNIEAQNRSVINAKIKGATEVTAASVSLSLILAETHHQTDIRIGKGAQIISEKTLTINAHSEAESNPRMELGANIGIVFSDSSFAYKNWVNSDVNVSIGANTLLRGWLGVNIHGSADAVMAVAHKSENGGFVAIGSLLLDEKTVRNVQILVDEGALIEAYAGIIHLLAETGKNDKITVDIDGSSKGFAGFSLAESTVDLKDTAKITIDGGSTIKGLAADVLIEAYTHVPDLTTRFIWDNDSLLGDLDAENIVNASLTSQVILGQKGQSQRANIRGMNITVRAALGDVDIDIRSKGDAGGAGKAAVRSHVNLKLDILLAGNNAYLDAVENIYLYATGYYKDVNTLNIYAESIAEVFIGGTRESGAKVDVSGRIEQVYDKFRRSAASDSWSKQWYTGFDNRTDSNGNRGYSVTTYAEKEAFLMDRIETNDISKTLNDSIRLLYTLGKDKFEVMIPIEPEIVIDIYEAPDGSLKMNVYGYNVNGDDSDRRKIPVIRLKNGVIYMDEIINKVRANGRITILNRTGYELSMRGISYQPADTGSGYTQQFYYYTTNNKDLIITKGIGSADWRMSAVEFTWLGDVKGKVYVRSDVTVDENDKQTIITIHADGSYTVTNGEAMTILNNGRLFTVSGGNIYMAPVQMKPGTIYEGGIYMAEGAAIPVVEGGVGVHNGKTIFFNHLRLINNSLLNLIIDSIIFEESRYDGSMAPVLEILSNTKANVSLSKVLANAGGSTVIRWTDASGSFIVPGKDTKIQTKTLDIQGASHVGDKDNSLLVHLYGDDSWVNIEISGNLYLTGDTFGLTTNTGGVESYTHSPKLRFKHLYADNIWLVCRTDALSPAWLIPVGTDGVDIRANKLSVGASPHATHSFGSYERPIVVDAAEVNFQYSKETLSGYSIYLKAGGSHKDLNLKFNGMVIYGESNESEPAMAFWAPEGSIYLTDGSFYGGHYEAGQIIRIGGDLNLKSYGSISAGSNIEIGGNLIVEQETKLRTGGNLKIGGIFYAYGERLLEVEGLYVGKSIKNTSDGVLTVRASKDIWIGSGIHSANGGFEFYAPNGKVDILGGEWLIGENVLQTKNLVIEAGGDITIGSGKGFIDTQDGQIHLLSGNGNILIAVSQINGGSWQLSSAAQRIEVPRLQGSYTVTRGMITLNGEDYNASVNSKEDIQITGRGSGKLSLVSDGKVSMMDGGYYSKLEVTADSFEGGDIVLANTSENPNPWQITGSAVMKSLEVQGETDRSLTAGSFSIGALYPSGSLILTATTGDIVIDGIVKVSVAGKLHLEAEEGAVQIKGKVSDAGSLNITAKTDVRLEEGIVINAFAENLFSIKANRIYMKYLEQLYEKGIIDIYAKDSIQIDEKLHLYLGDVNEENVHHIEAGGIFKSQLVRAEVGQSLDIMAGEVQIDTLQISQNSSVRIGSQSALTDKVSIGGLGVASSTLEVWADHELTFRTVTIQSNSNATFYAANAGFESGSLFLHGHTIEVDITAKSLPGTKETPWQWQLGEVSNYEGNNYKKVRLNIHGEEKPLWLKLDDYGAGNNIIDIHLSETIRQMHLTNWSSWLYVRINKEKGDLELELLETAPILEADVLEGNLTVTAPAIRRGHMNAGGTLKVISSGNLGGSAKIERPALSAQNGPIILDVKGRMWLYITGNEKGQELLLTGDSWDLAWLQSYLSLTIRTEAKSKTIQDLKLGHVFVEEGNLKIYTNGNLYGMDSGSQVSGNVEVYLSWMSEIDGPLLPKAKIYLNREEQRITSAEELATALGAEYEVRDTEHWVILKNDVVLDKALILYLNPNQQVVLDMSGRKLTAVGGIIGLERGMLRVQNGEGSGGSALESLIWLGTEGTLTLNQFHAESTADVIRYAGGSLMLGNNTSLESLDTKGTALYRIFGSLELNVESGQKVSVWIDPQSAPLRSGTMDDGMGSLLLNHQYAMIQVGEMADISDLSQADIILTYPEDYDSTKGGIIWDNKEVKPQVWLKDAKGNYNKANENWYKITYEKWDGSSWVPYTESLKNTGTYRAKMQLTEEGLKQGLKAENIRIIPPEGLVIHILPGSLDGPAPKDDLVFDVDLGREVTLAGLAGAAQNLFTGWNVQDVWIQIDGWENSFIPDPQSGVYSFKYLIKDDKDNASRIAEGILSILFKYRLNPEDFIFKPADIIPENDQSYTAVKGKFYGFTVESLKPSSSVTVSYSLDGIRWSSEPVRTDLPGYHEMYYKIEGAGYTYIDARRFNISKGSIKDYMKEGLLKFVAGVWTYDGKPLNWADESIIIYDSKYQGVVDVEQTFEIPTEKEGVYADFKLLGTIAGLENMKIEYRSTDSGIWQLYDGSLIRLIEEFNAFYYRISIDGDYAEPVIGYLKLIAEAKMIEPVVVVTEDGRVYLEGMTPGSEYEINIHLPAGCPQPADGIWLKDLTVGADGIAWIDASLLGDGMNRLSVFGGMYNTLEDGVRVKYIEYRTDNGMLLFNKEGLVYGISGIPSADGNKPVLQLNIPKESTDGYDSTKAYVLMYYDEAAGMWKYLGQTAPSWDAINNGTWSYENQIPDLEAFYQANGYGRIDERLRLICIPGYFFGDTEYEEERKKQLNEMLAYLTSKDGGFTHIQEMLGYMDIKYSVLVQQEEALDLRETVIRLEYPSGYYTVKDNILDTPIRVYGYDGQIKFAQITAVDKNGNKIILPEDAFQIIYERVEGNAVRFFRSFRNNVILPQEAGYLYRAKLILTEAAKEKYGLTEMNIQDSIIEFVIGAPQIEGPKFEPATVNIKTLPGELVNLDGQMAFPGLPDEYVVIVDGWMEAVSFDKEGIYQYVYYILSKFANTPTVTASGVLDLVVRLYNDEVTVQGFDSDQEADPNKKHQLVVKPVDTAAGLVVEYSMDGIHWQTETFDITLPGAYQVYYRVKNSKGVILKGGSDTITLTQIPVELPLDIVTTGLTKAPSTDFYDGIVSDKEQLFEVALGGSHGNRYVIEYSVFVPTADGGYWTEFTSEMPSLLLGENDIIVRVRDTSSNRVYYDTYERLFRITMAKEEVPKPDEPIEPDEPDKPIEPDEPDEPDKPIEPDEPDKPIEPKPDKPEAPELKAAEVMEPDGTLAQLTIGAVRTGDNVPLGLLLMLAFLSLFTAAAAMKQKHHKNKV